MKCIIIDFVNFYIFQNENNVLSTENNSFVAFSKLIKMTVKIYPKIVIQENQNTINKIIIIYYNFVLYGDFK